ncbi:BON domain-containing protein [Variovorax sp. J22R115]|uniref:BON domain-containing protein n=1 Tax=Variovorax sp. J22R115 TaxID=3053509 RepID=UPI002576A265|nr:BON domain-containing protein [Variovorax sp. J22R115]MDM0053119.1 BON domain-containing protein [Variovorax sp. J22R115]
MAGPSSHRTHSCTSSLAVLLFAGVAVAPAAQSGEADARTNFFDDPFFQVSSGLKNCPTPLGPFYSPAEVRSQMHGRLERGTSCWLAGRCKDSNAYRYDKAIAPQVRGALDGVSGIQRSSVWVTVQRRWVYLQGCVPTRDLSRRLERAAKAVPDVEMVLSDLMTGTRGKPPYPLTTNQEKDKE